MYIFIISLLVFLFFNSFFQQLNVSLLAIIQHRIARKMNEKEKKGAVANFISRLFKTKQQQQEEEEKKQRKVETIATQLSASAPIEITINPLLRARKR